jgi:hypothetical protein
MFNKRLLGRGQRILSFYKRIKFEKQLKDIQFILREDSFSRRDG